MPATGSIRAVSPAAGSGSGGRVLLQPAQTCATFRLYLPNRPCRLRFSLKTKESGALFKLYLSNNLLENLFDAPRMLGEEEQMSFVKPRGNLLKPRILYLHYLPPQCTAVDGGRDEITLDMSRFSGMTVDIAFVIEPGPLRQTLPVMGMWGEPVIETY
jgi:hypothetical protein